MSTENGTNKKSFSLDWLVGGVLTKLGDTFDRFTGRGWNPSSSLATSELVEKMKFLLDSEVRDSDGGGKFVPHIIKLKMQWNKFSTEADTELEKLKHELHAAAIDYINDKLYHTFAPLEIEIKTDYFTEGVRMLASFGKFAEDEADEVAVNVSIPNLQKNAIKDNKITVNLSEPEIVTAAINQDTFLAKFIVNNQSKEIELDFAEKKRISVGRIKENDLPIPDQSVSKVHASLVLDDEKRLKVADTGSTNGTFINGKRIAYGKVFVIEDGAKVKFGTVEVAFERLGEIEENLPEESENTEILSTEAFAAFSKSKIQTKNETAIIAENDKQKEFAGLDKTAVEVDLKNSENKNNETRKNNPQTKLLENDETQRITLDEKENWEI